MKDASDSLEVAPFLPFWVLWLAIKVFTEIINSYMCICLVEWTSQQVKTWHFPKEMCIDWFKKIRCWSFDFHGFSFYILELMQA